jgi:hypothetical protein
VFYIKNSRDFYEKLLQEFDDFQQDQLSARHAINCAITAHHMHEWVWGDWLKTDHAVWKKLGIRDKDSFVAWLEGVCPGFNTVQDIANGSKHFDRTAMQKTRATGAFDSAAFDHDAFDTARLEVQMDDGRGGSTHILAEVLFNNLIIFWRDFLRDHGPYADLPAPQAHINEFK